jgi:hypothetical protein
VAQVISYAVTMKLLHCSVVLNECLNKFLPSFEKFVKVLLALVSSVILEVV